MERVKSYHNGKQFEEIFRLTAIRQGVLPIQMPLGARRVGRRLIPIKTPFDFILIHQGITVFIDCKTFNKDSISHSDLTPHQVKALSDIQRFECAAGYLIHFRKSDAVCFVKASDLAKLEPQSSIHGKDMIYLGKISEFYLGRLFSLTWEKSWAA